MAMGTREMVVLVMLALLVVQMEAADAEPNSAATSMPWKTGRRYEADAVDEFLDEPMRRILATSTSYISYGALNGNRSPCPSAGRSYYNNCQNSGTVSPYRRSCVQITRCARG